MKSTMIMTGMLVLLVFCMGAATKAGAGNGGCATPAAKMRSAGGQAMFSGVGLVIADSNGCIEVIGVLEGYAADQAGIRPKDEIVQIDDRETRGMTMLAATELLRGPQRSRVTVVVKGADTGANRSLVLE